MKKILLTAVTVSGVLMAGGDMGPVEPVVVTPLPVVSESQSNFYVGLGLSAVSARDADVGLSFFSEKAGQDRLGNVTLIGGYNFNRYFAVEGRFTKTFAESDIVELEGYSAFIKPQYPLSDEINIYALLGYGHVKIDNTSVSEGSFQWGVGMAYAVTDEIDLFMDYTSLGRNMNDVIIDWDADALTIGVTYHF